MYDAYARYLVKFVQAYTKAGVPIDFLSIQNEPQNRKPSAYPGADMPVRQEAAVITALGPLLQKASPRTKILGYDHNWTTHPGDIASTPPGEDPETDYPYKLLRTSAAKWIAVRRTTATPAIRRSRPTCTTRSPPRASGSPSARGRTGRPTPRRRSSAARSPGTPAR